jgi:hypothetical protein
VLNAICTFVPLFPYGAAGTAFLFTSAGCVCTFTSSYSQYPRSQFGFFNFVLGAIFGFLYSFDQVLWYEVCQRCEEKQLYTFTCVCGFLAALVSTFLAVLFRCRGKRLVGAPLSQPDVAPVSSVLEGSSRRLGTALEQPIPQMQMSAPASADRSVEMAVMPMSLRPNKPLPPTPLHRAASEHEGHALAAKGTVRNAPRLAASPTASDDQTGELELAAIELSGFPAMPLCEVPSISLLRCSRGVLVFCRSCQAHSR